MCVCVCVSERERERERVCVCVCVLAEVHPVFGEKVACVHTVMHTSAVLPAPCVWIGVCVCVGGADLTSALHLH